MRRRRSITRALITRWFLVGVVMVMVCPMAARAAEPPPLPSPPPPPPPPPPPSVDRARAEKLFREGSDALERGRHEEACAKLAESEAIVQALGTEFNLGVCFELTHRPASAKRAFLIAASLAKQAGKESIAKQAAARAAKMDTAAPRLVIRVPKDEINAAVTTTTCDGKSVPQGEPIELDPGKHHIAARKEGRPAFTTTVDLVEARTTEVAVVFGSSSSTSSSEAQKKPVETDKPYDNAQPPWRILGIGAAGVGVVALGVSAYFGLSAKSGLDDSGCRDGRVCPNREAADRLDGAHRDADISTVLAIIGGVFLVGGGVLFFAAPSSTRSASATRATTLRPTIAAKQGGAALSLSARW